MKILQVAPSSPYNEGWGYQENLLPKYQAKLGNEVRLVVTNKQFENNVLKMTDEEDYISEDGFRVIRKAKRRIISNKLTELLSYLSINDILYEFRPDLVYCHGLSNITMIDIIKFKKKVDPEMIIVVDNHADYNIGPKRSGVDGKMIRWFWRKLNQWTIDSIDRVYGVTPWRKQFAKDYYGIPDNKTDVLIMGADDEKMHMDQKDHYRRVIRKKYSIREKEYLVVTGGKIDKKKNILELMEAAIRIENVKLLIFGNVASDVKQEFNNILEQNKNKIIYIGWIDASDVYQYFYAADLVFFPGQHSVLWEQACASKVPCVFRRWEGMEHVNNGGNAAFVEGADINIIEEKIISLMYSDSYNLMLEKAQSELTDVYLYSHIAEKSIECVISK